MSKPRMIAAAVAASFIFSLAPAAQAAGSGVCERHMAHYARKHDVPLGILYAVGLTESGRKGQLHPYALNVEGRSIFARNLRGAIKHFERERRNGAKLIDLGCMQINHYWHRKQFRSVRDMLDPRRNVAYAARFLKQLRRREKSWTLAVARYHAGPENDPAQKRYVCRVIRNMVRTGFARWTPTAKTFCH